MRGTTQPGDLTYDYQRYAADLAAQRYTNTPIEDGGTGAFDRRILAVPIGDCSGTTNGAGTVPMLGFGCFFVLQPVSHHGNDADVYGQFLDGCEAGVVPTPTPIPPSGTSPVYRIILFEDPDSQDS